MWRWWTPKKIKNLKRLAKQAQTKIKDLFVDNAISIENNKVAWGQFFNIRGFNPQKGIYGTGAGVQVLTNYDSEIDRRYVTSACEFISDVLSTDPANRFRQKGDIADVYKFAYIVSAYPPSIENLDEPNAQMEELANRQLDNSGWGEYYYSDLDRDITPKILPTSIVLLALKRYSIYSSSNRAHRAVAWLARKIQEQPNPPISEIALTILALQDYRTFEETIEDFEEAIKYCREKLLDWTKTRNPHFYGAKSFYTYSIDSDGTKGNRYIFLLTDCLVALAFLRLRQFSNERKYILKVVEFFVREILDKNGFAPDEQQVSTVDHLWIFKLLNEFKKVNIKNIIPRAPYILASYPVTLKIVVAVLFFLFGVIVAYFDFSADEGGWKFIRFVWIGLGMLGASLAAEIIAHIGLDKE
jgi:hypothetical protein